MARIVITEFMDQAAVDRLSGAGHDVTYDATLVDNSEALSVLVPQADALIVRNRTQVRGDLLSGLTKAKVVGRLGVGLDNIDVPGCEAAGIGVIPATGANAVAVAEYVIGTALFLVRGKGYRLSGEVLAGAWPRQQAVGGELHQRVLGLVGFGGIAREVAKRARGFEMTIIAYDPLLPAGDPVWAELGVRHVDLDELLTNADVVSLHVPLVDATRNMINAQTLSSMPEGAILINSARGGVVDEAAVAEALASGRLGGAALDVFADEPLPAGGALVAAPNLLATPHIAGVTGESNVRVSHLIADRVLEALA